MTTLTKNKNIEKLTTLSSSNSSSLARPIARGTGWDDFPEGEQFDLICKYMQLELTNQIGL